VVAAQFTFSRRPCTGTVYISANNGGTKPGYPGQGIIAAMTGVSGGAGAQISVGYTDVADGYITLSGNGNTAHAIILFDIYGHILAQLNVSGGWSALPPIIVPRGPMNIQVYAAAAATPYDFSIRRLVL
jgi:hypothetical protein